MYVELLSPIERDVFKIQDDSELPNQGACFRYMVNRNYQIRGVLQIWFKIPNEGGVFKI